METILSIESRWLSENNKRRQLWPLVLGAYAALVVHIVFLAVFFAHNVTPLFYFNLFSITAFALIIYVVVKKQAFRFSMMLATIEIYLHQMLATYYLGWDYGFQYYLLSIPVYLLLGDFRHRMTPVLISFFVVISIIAVYLFSLDHTPEYNLGNLEPWVSIINLVSVAILLAVYTGIFTTTSRALDTAMKQSQKDIELLYEAATIDDMTKLYNRMHSRTIIEMWLKQAYQDQKHFTVAFMDVDNFKQINDRLGHETGDDVLKHIARLLNDTIKENGLVARWGGEEFLVALPKAEETEAKAFLENIRQVIENNPFTGKNICTPLTITIGAVHLKNFRHKKELGELLKIADIALYEGKTTTKNRVVFRTSSQF